MAECGQSAELLHLWMSNEIELKWLRMETCIQTYQPIRSQGFRNTPPRPTETSAQKREIHVIYFCETFFKEHLRSIREMAQATQAVNLLMFLAYPDEPYIHIYIYIHVYARIK